MSVAEIKQAVQSLSPAELAELSAYIADCDAQAWELQIDADFSEDGRLRSVLDAVRADMRAG
jgi:anti-sigma factor RsiW